MRLGFFTMPLHPRTRDPAVTLQEDREALILADRLGFYDAFVGEHLTDPEENVTHSFIFLASSSSAPKTMKLGTGTATRTQICHTQSDARAATHEQHSIYILHAY